MNLKFPYEGDVYISSPYGYRTINGKKEWHGGLDLVGISNKTILAPCDGVVVSSTMIPKESGNASWEWGNYVCIAYEGYRIYMCHMAERLVTAGVSVTAGQPIGIEGNTGNSKGSHCHFEIRKNNQQVSPYSLLGIPAKAGVTYNNTFKGEDDMTKEEVLKIIEEYHKNKEMDKKLEPCPESVEDEFKEAIECGITDGTKPCVETPLWRSAIMCKRVFKKLNAKIERLSADIGDLKAYK